MATQNWVRDVTVSPDGTFIVSGSGDRTARVWDMKSLKQVGAPVTFNDFVIKNFIRSDCSTVVSACGDGTVHIWRVDSRQIISEFDFKFQIYSTRISFSPNGRFIVAENEHKIFIRTLDENNDKNFPFIGFGAQVRTNRSASVVATNTGSFIYIWTETEKSTFKIDHTMQAKHRFNGFSFSPCGKLLVISDRNWIEAWSVTSAAPRLGALRRESEIERSGPPCAVERHEKHSLICLTKERVPGNQDINVVEFDTARQNSIIYGRWS